MLNYTEENLQLIIDSVESLLFDYNGECDILYYIDTKEILLDNSNLKDWIDGDIDSDDLDFEVDDILNQIESSIQESNGFDIDIIYYSKAIEYLSNNDASLSESMGIASEMGYETKSINSELLASLLATQNEREQFYEFKNELEKNIIDSIDSVIE